MLQTTSDATLQADVKYKFHTNAAATSDPPNTLLMTNLVMWSLKLYIVSPILDLGYVLQGFVNKAT